MKVDLLLKDRLVLGGVLPAKGNFEDLIVYDDIKEKIKVTQEEVVKFQVHTLPGTAQMTWTITADVFSYEFTDIEAAKLKEVLEAKSKAKELSTDHMNLYRVIVKGEPCEIPVIEKTPEPKEEEAKSKYKVLKGVEFPKGTPHQVDSIFELTDEEAESFAEGLIEKVEAEEDKK